MNDKVAAFVMGAIVFAIVAAFMPGSILKEYHKAIAACEAELPRNMECEIIAVPKQETSHD